MGPCPESFSFSPTCEFDCKGALERSGPWPDGRFCVDCHTACRLVCQVLVLVLVCDLLRVFRVPEFVLHLCCAALERTPRAGDVEFPGD